MKPRLLDLFCGAGGCTRGYQEAGFYVVGVDINPQPNYCGDEFWRDDALEILKSWRGFDAVHASPPCQRYTGMNRRHAEARAANPDLIAPTRELLQETRLPYVIENVGGAVSELENPHRLCGRSLGIALHRHRLFETNFPLMAPPCTGGEDPFGVYGKLDGRRLWTRTDGSELRAASSLAEASEAMGIDWMGWDELRESIPPAMTRHIGGYLLRHLEHEASPTPTTQVEA